MHEDEMSSECPRDAQRFSISDDGLDGEYGRGNGTESPKAYKS